MASQKKPWSNVTEIDNKYHKKDTFFGIKRKDQRFVSNNKPEIIKGDKTFHSDGRTADFMERIVYARKTGVMPFFNGENIYPPKASDHETKFVKKSFEITNKVNKDLFDGEDFVKQKKDGLLKVRPYYNHKKVQKRGLYGSGQNHTPFFKYGYYKLIKSKRGWVNNEK